MDIIASLINMKGGGKSTICFNIAAYAAQEKNLKGVMIYLDPYYDVFSHPHVPCPRPVHDATPHIKEIIFSIANTLIGAARRGL